MSDSRPDERVERMEFLLGLRRHGITDAQVLRAMDEVPRDFFVDPDYAKQAFADHALPIACGQTISQPYVVAYMTEELQVGPTHSVLEIGTGSGYQAAILGELAAEVYTIEIVPELADRARTALEAAGYRNVHVRHGNGYLGWPEAAPFDRIIVTAAPDHVPPTLVAQLKPGGRLVIPVGTLFQELMVVQKKADGSTANEQIVPVRFVPLTRDRD